MSVFDYRNEESEDIKKQEELRKWEEEVKRLEEELTSRYIKKLEAELEKENWHDRIMVIHADLNSGDIWINKNGRVEPGEMAIFVFPGVAKEIYEVAVGREDGRPESIIFCGGRGCLTEELMDRLKEIPWYQVREKGIYFLLPVLVVNTLAKQYIVH